MTVRNPRGVDTAPLPNKIVGLKQAVGVDLSTVGSDLQEQLAEHSRRTLSRHHGGDAMQWPEAAVLDFAERCKPLADFLHHAAYFVADQLYDERWKTGDGARERTVRQIAEHLGCSPSTARYALQAAELGRRLPVDRLGTPDVQQLTVIAWADVKTRGWDQITAWMKRNGFTFENTSRDALKDYCEQLKKDAKAEERDREFASTHGDPHDPPDAVVVEDDDPEEVPKVGTDEPEPDDEELRAWRRKTKALAELDDFLARVGNVANLDEIPDGDEELLERLGDFDRLADLAARLRAKAKAMPAPPDWDELPL
jgi:hypothetical protein